MALSGVRSHSDIQAAEGLMRLHTELINGNPDWGSAARSDDMNRFMARLILDCFAKYILRAGQELSFGGWLSEPVSAVPVFSELAKLILADLRRLDWRKISPEVFGAMIQTVTGTESRDALGMHFTGVANILKVLDPLFLDELRAELKRAGDDHQKLQSLGLRLSTIRVFDPACGAGNFLLVAYRELRAIEQEVLERCGLPGMPSNLPLTNFFGIELLEFSAKLAQLALNIAKLQYDLFCGAAAERDGKAGPPATTAPQPVAAIVCGNALRTNWSEVCPPLASGQTYICGNPPFKGSRKQQASEKEDLKRVFSLHTQSWKNVEYAGAWLLQAAVYNQVCVAPFAFVATNSLCQGQQVPITWAIVAKLGFALRFAHTSFKWENLVPSKACVTVVIVGLDSCQGGKRWLFFPQGKREVETISPYLTEHQVNIVRSARRPLFGDVSMQYGVYYSKSGGLLLTLVEKEKLLAAGLPTHCVRRFIGSTQFLNAKERYCLWLSDEDLIRVKGIPAVRRRIARVRRDRLKTTDREVNKLASRPHQFRERKGDGARKIFVPIVSSEHREYFPAGMVDGSVVPTNKAFYIPNGPLWALSVLVSKLHLAWLGTVCGRLEMRYSYSNTLGWNTFPLPKLSEKNQADLADCANEILRARTSHTPATLAELYEPSQMPVDLRAAHERNDEVLERIYIGRRFRDDNERLNRLFELYSCRVGDGRAGANPLAL